MKMYTNSIIFCELCTGRLAEWSKATHSKRVILKGIGGSNPSSSALKPDNQVIAIFTHRFAHRAVTICVFFLFAIPSYH